MESGITTPPKMRRVAENEYETGVNITCIRWTCENEVGKSAMCMSVVTENNCRLKKVEMCRMTHRIAPRQ